MIRDDLEYLDVASWQFLEYLWNNNRGIVIMGAYRALPMDSPLSSMLSDRDRYLNIVLDILDFASTKQLCDAVFSSYDLTDIDETTYGTIYQMSGGNTLFSFEIAKIAAENCLASFDPVTKKYAKISVQFTSGRVEEVIYHRFDQLEDKNQLVLKMASVCCANNSFTTLYMLAFVMDDDSRKDGSDESNKTSKGSPARMMQHHNSSSEMGRVHHSVSDQIAKLKETGVDLVAIINSILKRDEFLKIIGHIPTDNHHAVVESSPLAAEEEGNFGIDAASAATGYTMEQLLTLAFNFGVSIEQQTVYGLMLDDQKRWIHYRTALYIESLPGSKELSALLLEQAYHWSRAEIWSAALESYYNLSLAMERFNSMKECAKHCGNAFAMLEKMRSRVLGNRTNPFDVDAVATHLGLFANADDIAGAESVKLTRSTSDQSVSQRISMKGQSIASLADLYAVMEGDADLLEITLIIMVKLGVFILKTDVALATYLISTALRLIDLTNSKAVNEARKSRNDSRIPEKVFGFKDPSICFPVLSQMALLFNTKKLTQDISKYPETLCICQTYEALADSSPKYGALKIMSFIHWYDYFSMVHDKLNCTKFAEKIMFTYKHVAHTKLILKLYSFDPIPITLATELQLKALRGEFDDIGEYFSYFDELLPTIKHLDTLGMTVLPLTAFYVGVGNFKAAKETVACYQELDAELSSCVKHLQNIMPLVDIWVSFAATLAEMNNNAKMSTAVKSPRQTSMAPSDLVENVQLERMLKLTYLFSIEERPSVFSQVDEFTGLHVEYICAHTLYIAARIMSTFENISTDVELQNLQSKYLNVAAEYLVFATKHLDSGPWCKAAIELLTFQVNAEILKTHSDTFNHIHKTESATKDSVEKAISYGQQMDFPLFSLQCASEWKRLLNNEEVSAQALRKKALTLLKSRCSSHAFVDFMKILSVLYDTS
jgi:hypothetical protein